MALVSVLAAGCGGGGGGGSDAPVGPDLRGDWIGAYANGEGASRSLTATIRQDGDAVFLSTSLIGRGARLTGTSTADGSLFLTDAFDGEIWTTYFRPATPARMQIGDFVRPPEPDAPLPPLRIIDLRRAS